MTDKIKLKLAEIEALCEGATEGPWHLYCGFGSSDLPISIVKETGSKKIIAGVDCDDNEYIVDVNEEAKRPTIDMRFIAQSRALVPKLKKIAEIAVDALEEISKKPYEDSDSESLLLWIEGRSKKSIAEIEKELGG